MRSVVHLTPSPRSPSYYMYKIGVNCIAFFSPLCVRVDSWSSAFLPDELNASNLYKSLNICGN